MLLIQAARVVAAERAALGGGRVGKQIRETRMQQNWTNMRCELGPSSGEQRGLCPVGAGQFRLRRLLATDLSEGEPNVMLQQRGRTSVMA